MTLADILPTLRSSLPPRLDAEVWPVTARWDGRGGLEVGGVRLDRMAAEHGTPVRVVDETDVRARAIGCW